MCILLLNCILALAGFVGLKSDYGHVHDMIRFKLERATCGNKERPAKRTDCQAQKAEAQGRLKARARAGSGSVRAPPVTKCRTPGINMIKYVEPVTVNWQTNNCVQCTNSVPHSHMHPKIHALLKNSFLPAGSLSNRLQNLRMSFLQSIDCVLDHPPNQKQKAYYHPDIAEPNSF